MDMALSEISTSVEEDERKANNQIMLNIKAGQTIGHGLVLLEGELKPVYTNELSCKTATNEAKPEVSTKENTDLKSQTFSSSKPNEVLIHHQGLCSRWPVVERRFKAFVKLDKGLNLLKLQCCELKVEKELKLCYEKQKNHRFVRVVYIKCSDGDGSFDAPDDVNNALDVALKKLRFNAQLLQTFMAEEMNRHGFGYQTFQLEEAVNGQVVVHVFTSELTTERAHEMNGDELYSWFHSELTSSSLNDPNCKFLAFMSCSHYDPPDKIIPKDIPRYVKAHTALGGGQLGLFGTAGLHTWAEEVGELLRCFTDTREIDKKKMFDDSAGRGTFWANYSTTLGAALHELGHCCDLMHMPEGIMGRGFDDMNHFVLVTSSKRHCLPPAESTAVSDAVPKAMEMFTDNRAHWFRSSAVLLHYHKWLRPCVNEVLSTSTQNPQPCLQINWSHQVKGPIGNGGKGQENQSYFDDLAWHNSRDLTPAGYVVYHGEYINALIPSAGDLAEDCPVYGKIPKDCSIHKFSLEEDEYLTSLEVRAGAWVDGIRFHSNMKSSIWFGGRGGDWYRLEPDHGDCIAGIFGTFGDYLGSLGIRLSKRKFPEQSHSTSIPTIQSDIGIGLVELRREDELINFWEFVQCDTPPKEFSLPLSWLQPGTSAEGLSMMAVDIDGNICKFGFVGYEDFRKGIGHSRMNTDKEVLVMEVP